MKRYLLGAAVLALAVVVVAGWVVARERRASDEAKGRYLKTIEQLEEKGRAVEALLPALEARDRDLVERLVKLQARERTLAAELATARQASAAAATRAAELPRASTAEILRAGEELGVRARVR